jgi:3-carboxy-cis,cis-muconate cycloisomerase
MFDALFVPADARDALGDSAWLAALVEVEAALARAEVAAGVIPEEAGEAIGAACRPGAFDPSALVEEGRAPGNPVEPLVRALREAVGDDGAAQYVHFGATSQDILDTAAMLVSGLVLGLILERLEAVAEECAQLADAHRVTPMIGRTLLQQAEAVTFGLKAAGWLVAVLDARTTLVRVRDERLAVQLGGASGTAAPLGDSGPEVLRLLARELELAEPVAPWHTNRTRIAELGAALAITSGVAGKIGLDIGLMSQSEVGEVSEANPGASSAMPHKRNPVVAERICGLARVVRSAALVGLENVALWHERDISHSSAERVAIPDAFLAVDYMLDRFTWLIEGLVVRPERMLRNLEASRGLFFSQRLLLALVERGLERARAYELVQRAAMRAWEEEQDFAELARADPEIAAALDPAALEDVFDLTVYTRHVDVVFERLHALTRREEPVHA